jgi:hypothetical protein
MPESRGRRPQHTPKVPTKTQEAPTMRWSRTKKLFVGSVTVVATVIGIVSGMVTLLPRLDVQSTDRFDPLHPSPIPFTITNSGALSLYNVQFFVGVCKVEWGPRPGATATLRSQNECNGLSEVRFSDPTWHLRGFVVGQKFVIRYDDYMPHPSVNGMRLVSAEISVGAKFNPWKLPWPMREIEFRYKTRQEGDGTLSWIPEALEK